MGLAASVSSVVCGSGQPAGTVGYYGPRTVSAGGAVTLCLSNGTAPTGSNSGYGSGYGNGYGNGGYSGGTSTPGNGGTSAPGTGTSGGNTPPGTGTAPAPNPTPTGTR